MVEEHKSFEKALLESWKQFRKKLPGKIGDYLDPKTAFEKVIKHNGVAVLTELKESKDALGLLFRLASSGHLPEEEQQRLKTQLADLAKTIPALGIFALPGGLLLLPILAKSLPWNILPSAFIKQELKEELPSEDEGKESPDRPNKG